jgi:cytochrome bd-type quinol oxidase subunit 2
MDRHPNIINAASNLLGICFLIIAGLSLTKSNSRSIADEVAWVAAVCFLASLALSYIAIRKQDEDAWQGIWADRIFLLGVAALTVSTLVVGFALS